MAVVYIHKKKNSDEVFYVGIGSTEERAFDKYSRNRWWKFIVQKYDYDVQITHKNLLWEEACVIEKYLICFYGRKDLLRGTLCNLTDGGDGSFGYIPSKESKIKTSTSLKGYKRTDNEIQKTRNTKIKIGTYKRMSKRTMRINIITNEEIIFETLSEASKKSDIPRSTIHLTLNNKTNKNGERIYAGGYDWKYI